MVDTVTIDRRDATVSMMRIERCNTRLLVRSGETRIIDGTERRSSIRFESNASLELTTNSEFVLGC